MLASKCPSIEEVKHLCFEWLVVVFLYLCDLWADCQAHLTHLKLAATIYIAQYLSTIVDSPIVRVNGRIMRNGTSEFKNITLLMKHYYANDEQLTTSSAYRWLRKFNSPADYLDIIFVHNDRICNVVIDLLNSEEMSINTRLRKDSISLEYLYTLAEKKSICMIW